MIMDEQKISVIVPVYQVEEYLDRCITSILSQSYGNLEIILVDDGSGDKSGTICDEYAKLDNRIRVIHKPNGGLSSARNTALDIATGDYVGFVDGDDYVHRFMFEKLIKAAVEHSADIAVCGHFTEKDNRITIKEPILDSLQEYTGKEALRVLIEDKWMNNYAWDKLYKAELFRGVRYPEGRNYEDIATTYLLFDRSKKIVQIPEYLYYYQIRSGSISSHADEKKWFTNCCQIIESNRERYSYFFQNGEQELGKLAFAGNLGYVYEALKRAYQFGATETIDKLQAFLTENQEAIRENEWISEKDKKIRFYYLDKKRFERYQLFRKPLKKVRSYKHRLQSHFRADYDVSLREGKSVRYIVFELPCFDNLGDHAIAYAQKEIVEYLAKKDERVQTFYVDGWDTVRAVNSLKRKVGREDIIFCQGGGNLGNMYGFAQELRKKVLKAFYQNRIVIFPQTMYFTKDRDGARSLTECRRYFSKCRDLTILARDHVSYEMMKRNFNRNSIIEMPDVVSFLNQPEALGTEREGILFCLRSDIEGNIDSKEHSMLLEECEKVCRDVKVTDTCENVDISKEMREDALRKKWDLYGKYRLVVTDRLHGMIFSMITKTPCIIMGNNHHKVKETYEVFRECEYLYFADSIEEAISLISKVFHRPLPQEGYKKGSLADWDKIIT